MDNLVFKDSLINVLFSLTQLLCIDKIQQVGIFEHLNGTEGLFVVWDCVDEVVRHFALVMVSVLGDSLLETLYSES